MIAASEYPRSSVIPPMLPAHNGSRMSPLFVGDATKKPERVTFHAPSRLLLALAGVTMAGALALYVSGRREAGVFVGLWPLGMLSMGNYIREMKRVGADPPQGAF